MKEVQSKDIPVKSEDCKIGKNKNKNQTIKRFVFETAIWNFNSKPNKKTIQSKILIFQKQFLNIYILKMKFLSLNLCTHQAVRQEGIINQ